MNEQYWKENDERQGCNLWRTFIHLYIKDSLKDLRDKNIKGIIVKGK